MAKKIDEALSPVVEQEIVKDFCEQNEQIRAKTVSQRGQKTYIFPCTDKDYYFPLINDVDRFRSEVVDNLHQHNDKTGHKSSCKDHETKKYRLSGFRKNSRKTITSGGKKETFPIRVVECVVCGQRFSLLPSFLPREKRYGIDIIENVC